MCRTARSVEGTLIVVGNEVLYGDVVDINTSTIGKTLFQEGFLIARSLILSDNRSELAKAIRYWHHRSDFLITTGGLEPATNNVICDALCDAFGLQQVRNRAYCETFRKRINDAGLSWADETEWMAYLPEGAVELTMDRPYMGFRMVVENKPLYCLPGVPTEVAYLVEREVLPDLKNHYPERTCFRRRIIRVQRLSEWEVAKRVGKLDLAAVGVGYLSRIEGETWVTLTVCADNGNKADEFLNEAERRVVNAIGRKFVSGKDGEELEKVVGDMLRSRGMKLAVAESCTGGMLAARIISVPGASDYFERGYIVYSNKAKVEELGVNPDVLERYGAVSEQTARAMAVGAKEKAGVDVALGITGIAGPTGGTREKPVGTVFIGCACDDRTVVEHHVLRGERQIVQMRSVQAALRLLWELLAHDSSIHSS
ncbi:MAG TPA: nicotinamide-nucleotide amidohydrolase family protein [Thermodesulforhabdus norvegica]|uniref:CinA-like protein n=1 Tax=Thermodesulforhabdus norvegica TaxID=39841 RepID=A0A7C0WST4_9BACT|nr:nicotinamide-nucleotide amidohydrolase family protein [Thermodesulforhabdus norvegica]